MSRLSPNDRVLNPIATLQSRARRWATTALTALGFAAVFALVFYSHPALASPLVDCGGEGESPCAVFDAVFWDNGTGFCDAGLQAVDFNVLPDIPAFRANAWVSTSETSVQPLREIVAAATAIAGEIVDPKDIA